jgi:hypothetical protein
MLQRLIRAEPPAQDTRGVLSDQFANAFVSVATGISKSGERKVMPMAGRKTAVKKTTRRRKQQTSHQSGGDNYTRPDLREKIKKQVLLGNKGGRPGQWSARKAQLVAHEYESEGGGYKHSRNATQKSLQQWSDERWHTGDGKEAVQGDETHRYLPDAAWKKLSPEQRKAADLKKVAASKRGKQFVANTHAAARARKLVTKHD